MDNLKTLLVQEEPKNEQKKVLGPLKTALKKKNTLRGDLEIINGGFPEKKILTVIENKVRKDKFGIPIKKNSKAHRISFHSELIEVIEVESYKELYYKLSIHVNENEKVECNCKGFSSVCLTF